MQAPRPLLATLPLLAALLAATAAAPASAQEVDNENRVQGKLRFHVDTDFFGWTHSRNFTNTPNAPLNAANQVGFGFARPLAGEANANGVGAFLGGGGSMFGLGLGYGISRYLILGARMGMSFDHYSAPTDAPYKNTNNYFSTIFTPYLEILPLPRGRILPFILVRSGFQAAAFGDRTKGTDPILGEVDSLDRTSFIAPTIGVGAGAHFLLTDRFSLDLSLMFDYRWYFSKSRQSALNTPTLTNDWEKAGRQSSTLGAVLGFSVWFL
jgi:opacity protein-like surface antigen